MNMTNFYREQASVQQAAADAAALDNVRDRCQRAADAWCKLADRLDHADKLRADARTDQLAAELLDRAHTASA